MSIVTKTGDAGMTALMFNRRVPKSHPRVEACGVVDELNAALGQARAAARSEGARGRLLDVQKDLVGMMGELATAPEDRARYQQEGFAVLAPGATAWLDREIEALEGAGVGVIGWAMPGGGIDSAALDLARTVCRRAERRVSTVQESDTTQNPEILIYLNRLSDLLWLLAREADRQSATPAQA
jgi:cob(I)alamin adenosyltransferase